MANSSFIENSVSNQYDLLKRALLKADFDKFRFILSLLSSAYKTPEMLTEKLEPFFFQQIAHRVVMPSAEQIFKSYEHYGMPFSPGLLIKKNAWVIGFSEYQPEIKGRENLSAFELGDLFIDCLKTQSAEKKENAFRQLLLNDSVLFTNKVAQNILDNLLPYNFELSQKEFVRLLLLGENHPELATKIIQGCQIPKELPENILSDAITHSFYALDWAINHKKEIDPVSVEQLTVRMLKFKRNDRLQSIIDTGLLNVDANHSALISGEIGKSHFGAVKVMLPYSQECVRLEALLWDLPNRLGAPQLRENEEYIDVYNRVKIMVEQKALNNSIATTESNSNGPKFKL